MDMDAGDEDLAQRSLNADKLVESRDWYRGVFSSSQSIFTRLFWTLGAIGRGIVETITS